MIHLKILSRKSSRLARLDSTLDDVLFLLLPPSSPKMAVVPAPAGNNFIKSSSKASWIRPDDDVPDDDVDVDALNDEGDDNPSLLLLVLSAVALLLMLPPIISV